MNSIYLPVGHFRSPEHAMEREWLISNGIGGYASSSILGANTRRYHGLLIAAMNPPLGRMAALAKLEEALLADGERWDLSVNQYEGAIHPGGFRHFQSFSFDGRPTFIYQAGPARIEKSLVMPRGENAATVRYRFFDAPPGARLTVSPLFVWRDFHGLAAENGCIRKGVKNAGDWDELRLYDGAPSIFCHAAGIPMTERPVWHRGVRYEREAERGFDCREDYFCPGFWEIPADGGDIYIKTAVGEPGDPPGPGDFEAFDERLERLYKGAGSGGGPMGNEETLLARAADTFVVSRNVSKSEGEGGAETSKTVLAGYHWFGDWGRDAMISLTGLTLCLGRNEVARQVLETFARHCDRGMLPNRFPDYGEEPQYNTVDAAMWFFYAAYQYLAYTNDWGFAEQTLLPAFEDIVKAHVEGTRYGIRADEDGLIRTGEEGTQLTWMDAAVDGWVVTPRTGKPVEVNALWAFGLWLAGKVARKLGRPSGDFEERFQLASSNFELKFWNPKQNCLFDVVSDDKLDASIRPNQTIAMSLPISLLSPEKAKSAWRVAHRELYTPYGLRSLSPRDPEYCPVCAGDRLARDGAYHRGTVWAWLMGPHLTAYRNVFGRAEETRKRVRDWLSPLMAHLSEACVGSASEIFDGDPPHAPRGCVSQAWSVAEILRLIRQEACGDPPQIDWTP